MQSDKDTNKLRGVGNTKDVSKSDQQQTFRLAYTWVIDRYSLLQRGLDQEGAEGARRRAYRRAESAVANSSKELVLRAHSKKVASSDEGSSSIDAKKRHRLVRSPITLV